MNLIITILTLFLISSANAGTCTSISRTNNVANTVLTSTKYNADLNTSYTAINSADGGCITDGTLEKSSLSSSDFSTIVNAPKIGCKVEIHDANTLAVSKCKISVNGSDVSSASSTATWLCTDCSAEAASTSYYLYAKTGSTGSTLDLLISVTAPNGDGYDVSGNRALAKFYNNASSDILFTSLQQWNETGFKFDVVDTSNYLFTLSSGFGLGTNSGYMYKVADRLIGQVAIKSASTAASDLYVTLSEDYIDVNRLGILAVSASTSAVGIATRISGTTDFNTAGYSFLAYVNKSHKDRIYVGKAAASASEIAPAQGTDLTDEDGLIIQFDVPLAGALDE